MPTEQSAEARPPKGRKRRTQAERSSDMRRRACEATLETLCTVGFDRLSLGMVAAKAGISRGAITHHYQSKQDLFVGAFEHMIGEWKQQRANFIATHRAISIEGYLRFFWKEVFGKPNYLAAIDLMFAARADAELQARLRTVLMDWMNVRDMFSQSVLGEDVGGIPRVQYMQVSMSMMRGMAVHSSFDLDPQTSETLLDTWISITKRLMAGPHDADPDTAKTTTQTTSSRAHADVDHRMSDPAQ